MLINVFSGIYYTLIHQQIYVDVLEIASNTKKALGAHLNTCGAFHIFLRGASERAWGSGFSNKLSNLVPQNVFISMKYL